MSTLTTKHIIKLKHAPSIDSWLALLASYNNFKITQPTVLKAFHQMLIFHLAYPSSANTLKIVQQEIQRITEMANGIKSLQALANSGLPNTAICCSFSSSLSDWLCHEYGKAVFIEGSTASPETIQNIFQAILPGIEYENSTQENLSLIARIQKIAGFKNAHEQLKWLMQLFRQANLPALVKEEMYRQLSIYIQWDIASLPITIDALRYKGQSTYYHKDFIRNINSHKIVNTKLKPNRNISNKQKTALLDFMKLSLAKMCRETDPITYGDINQLKLFEMGRGVQIALVGMQMERRLTLESYIGFMAFKNGIPVSYGGGWIWGHRCKIGVNIFPAFRKGESAWLFSQILRLYHQYYTIQHFVVKPYQFGKGNPEGLQSGAFWFYYKLGFRPESNIIAQNATFEYQKIQSDKNYRSSIKTLQSFTLSTMEWKLAEKASPNFDAGKLSKIISDYINLKFNGNRNLAVQTGKQLIKKILPIDYLEKIASSQSSFLDNWGIFFYLLNNTTALNTKEITSLSKLIQKKAGNLEYDYIQYLQKQSWLWARLTKIFTSRL